MVTLEMANRVGATTFTTPSDRELVATRVFDAPRSLVFEAHTRSEHLPRWMLGPEGWTMPVCEIDLREGGSWHFAWRGPDGTEMEMRGVYREVSPPERLVHTESWGGDWPETLNTLVLSQQHGETTITCTVLYPSQEARDAAIATGMQEGWAASYDRLDEYLARLKQGPAKTVKAVPAGHHTVTPYLAIQNAAEALEFYKKAFGAVEVYRLMMPDGRLGHAEIVLGDSAIMLSDEFPEFGGKAPPTLGGSPVSLHLYVEDVDALFDRALAAGAHERKPVMDQFYGDRSGQLEDPFGHLWWVATHKEDVSTEEMQRRVQAMFAAGKK